MADKNEDEKAEKKETAKIVMPKGIDVSTPKEDKKVAEESEEKPAEPVTVSPLDSEPEEETDESKAEETKESQDPESPISDMKMPLGSPVKPVEPSSTPEKEEPEEKVPEPITPPPVTPLESEPVVPQPEAATSIEPSSENDEPAATDSKADKVSPVAESSEEGKKYADSYPLADEVEQEALKKSNGNFFSKLIRIKNKKVRWVVGILVIVLLIILGVGTFMNSRGNNLLSTGNDSESALETVNPTPTEEPTPTPIEVDRESLVIQVLNGSGEGGVAGTMADFLVEKGYSEDIDTGNADSYDYTETVVQIKESLEEEYLDVILDDLKKDYSLSSEIETLDEDSDFDVVIIVGAE